MKLIIENRWAYPKGKNKNLLSSEAHLSENSISFSISILRSSRWSFPILNNNCEGAIVITFDTLAVEGNLRPDSL
jgi:hypothetical protein